MAEGTKAKVIYLTAGIILASGSLVAIARAQSASLYINPDDGSFEVGRTFSVSVYVSSAGSAINAASGVISFPPDKLRVTSVSKSGSIFNLWVQEPSFSNTDGTVNFEGIVFNPGFAGSAGKIITINFRAVGAGSAPVGFAAGSVLANDGRGTNVLASLGNANYFLTTGATQAPVSAEEPETAGPGNTPGAPKISSPTHPDPEKWYSVSSAKFTWPVGQGVTASRLLFGRLPKSSPSITYTPAIDSKEIPNLENGVWYFHAQLKNAAGWGGISHFRFQIDTELPDRFEIQEIKRTDLTEPKVKFIFNAHDAVSGIDHYEIQIDDGEFSSWKDDGNHTYETPVLGPGNHILTAKATDRAGNYLMQSKEFTVQPLEAPVITEYPPRVKSGETLAVKGRSSYPNSQVNVWLEREEDSPIQYTITSDGEGRFILETRDKLKAGQYKVWAEVVDSRGAKSNPSEKVDIAVEGISLFPQLKIDFSKIIKAGSELAKALAVLVQLIALIVLLLIILRYAWQNLILPKRPRGSRDVWKQIITLERVKSRPGISEEEKKVIKELESTLDKAEELVLKVKSLEERAKELKLKGNNSKVKDIS